MKWFGRSWGAPVCDPRDHVDTPVGEICYGHAHMHEGRELIDADDDGVLIPYYGEDAPLTNRIAYHLDCWLHEIGADRL